MTTSKHNDEVKEIVEALYNKNKRGFYSKGKLYKQALHFSPFYRDFVLKIIKNNSLKIKRAYQDGSYYSKDEQYTGKLSKRGKGVIETDIDYIDTLPHELGHAVDFWFGNNQALTSNVILSNGKTLREIFDKEFNEKFDDIYQGLMEEFKFIVNKNIQPDAYDILVNNIEIYKTLAKTKDPEERRRIQKLLYECGFVEVYYQLYTKKWYQLLNEKYAPIIDAISAKVELNSLFLMGHTVEYYRLYKSRGVQEFFANLFEAKVTSEHVTFKELKRLLPESFAGFEELFYIFYDRLQNNKRFTDVGIRRIVEENYVEL